MDKPIIWDPDKNSTLKALRGISFEEVFEILERDDKIIISSRKANKKYKQSIGGKYDK